MLVNSKEWVNYFLYSLYEQKYEFRITVSTVTFKTGVISMYLTDLKEMIWAAIKIHPSTFWAQ